MTRRRIGCLGVTLALVGLCAFPLFWRYVVREWYANHIFDMNSVPEKPAAVVYGAAVYRNDRLSSVLRDRMDTAIALYRAGLVRQLVVSGDNRVPEYNEPAAMMAYAVAQGVLADDILPDYGGWRTYDTCYRARHVFGLESAVLVTQAFHLPRALFTCESMGLDVVGVAADQRSYRGARWYEFRETAATLVALWDVVRRKPPSMQGDARPLD